MRVYVAMRHVWSAIMGYGRDRQQTGTQRQLLVMCACSMKNSSSKVFGVDQILKSTLGFSQLKRGLKDS